MQPQHGRRHLGLDLGGTNIKWAVVEHDGDDWRTLATGQVPTGAEGRPGRRGRRGSATTGEAVDRRPGPAWPRSGSASRACTTRRRARTRFLVNIPGAWAGQPVAGPVGRRGSACRRSSSTTRGPSASRSSGSAPGAARRSMVGLTLGTGVGGVIAIDGRVHQGHDGTAGEVGPPDDRPGRAVVRLRQPRLPRGVRARRPAGRWPAARRPPRRPSTRARAGDERALDGLAQVGRYLGIGIANMVTVISPDRVVIGGGVAAAGDLLFEPIRAELRLRVRTTSLDAVTIVAAELGDVGGRDRRGGPRRRTGGRDRARRSRRVTLDALRPALAADRAGAARAHRRPVAGRRAPVRRGAVRRVRGQPDDRAQRDAAARRRGARRSASRVAAASSRSRRPTAAPTGCITFSREMERAGRRPSSRVLNREIRPSTPDEASALGVAAGASPSSSLRRLRLADERADRDRDGRARAAAPGPRSCSARTSSAGRSTTRSPRGGYHLRRGIATITAAPATHDDARLLGLATRRRAARRAAGDLDDGRAPDRGHREPLPGGPLRAGRPVRRRGAERRRPDHDDGALRGRLVLAGRGRPGPARDRGRLDPLGRP